MNKEVKHLDKYYCKLDTEIFIEDHLNRSIVPVNYLNKAVIVAVYRTIEGKVR